MTNKSATKITKTSTSSRCRFDMTSLTCTEIKHAQCKLYMAVVGMVDRRGR